MWAGNVTPLIRSFVMENREHLKNKHISAFACQSGSGGEKAFRKLLECLKADRFVATMVLNDPKDKSNAANDALIEEFRSKLE